MEKKYRDKEWLEEQYLVLGRTQAEIAQELGVHYQTVKNWAKRYGLEKTDYHFRHVVPTKEWLEEHYLEKNLSIRELADKLGTSNQPIQTWLGEYGIRKPKSQLGETHSKRMSGEGNPAWLDGNSQGYQRRKLEESGRGEKCEWCGTALKLQVHHIDHDHANHNLENLMCLCGTCNRMEACFWALQQSNLAQVKKTDNQLTVTFMEVRNG